MIKNKKLKFRLVLFYFSYFFILFYTLGNRIVVFQPYIPIISKVSLMLIVINFLFSINGTKKENIKLLYFFMLSSTITYFILDDATMLLFFLIIYSARNYDSYKIIKFDFLCRIIITLFIFSNYFLGNTIDYLVVDSGVTRYSLGFSHPNLLGFNLLMLYYEYAYIRRMKLKVYDIFIFLGIFYIIKNYSMSRASMYFLFIILFCQIFYKYICLIIKKSNGVRYLIKNILIICTVFTFFVTFLYNYDFGKKLNIVLSNRLYYNNYFMTNYNITLLGQKLPLISNEEAKLEHTNALILDNSYLTIIYKFGAIAFIMFLILLKKAMKILIENNKYCDLIILFVLVVYGFIENYMFRIIYNPFLLLLVYAFYVSNKELNKSERNKNKFDL